MFAMPHTGKNKHGKRKKSKRAWITPHELDRLVGFLHMELSAAELQEGKKHPMTHKPYPTYKEQIQSTWQERMKAISAQGQAALKRSRGHLVDKMFGTQEPMLRLRSDPTTDGYTAGIADVNVEAVHFQGLHDQGSWAAVFDEYIIRRGRVYWKSYLDAIGTNNRGLAAGVIDYDDNTAITTLANLIAYDTCKVFTPATSVDETFAWSFEIQGPPDTAWTTTSSDYTPCYFKWNCFSGTSTIGTAYSIWYECEVEFRQVEV